MFKYNVGLKTLLQEGMFEPEFNGNIIYKFRKTVDKTDFSEQVKKIVTCYKKIGYNMDILWQTARMVVNTITVDNFASHFNFNFTMVGFIFLKLFFF